MKMPSEWAESKSIASKPSKVTASTQVKARIDMSEERAGKGLCPECGKPMQRVFANNIPCLCCMEDRIVLPLADSEIEQE
jgi:hypothetical protein